MAIDDINYCHVIKDGLYKFVLTIVWGWDTARIAGLPNGLIKGLGKGVAKKGSFIKELNGLVKKGSFMNGSMKASPKGERNIYVFGKK